MFLEVFTGNAPPRVFATSTFLFFFRAKKRRPAELGNSYCCHTDTQGTAWHAFDKGANIVLVPEKLRKVAQAAGGGGGGGQLSITSRHGRQSSHTRNHTDQTRSGSIPIPYDMICSRRFGADASTPAFYSKHSGRKYKERLHIDRMIKRSSYLRPEWYVISTYLVRSTYGCQGRFCTTRRTLPHTIRTYVPGIRVPGGI